MKSLLALLVLSLAFQGILCDICFSGWKKSIDTEYYFCRAPRNRYYSETTGYRTQAACLKVYPDGCKMYLSAYFANCIEGYSFSRYLPSELAPNSNVSYSGYYCIATCNDQGKTLLGNYYCLVRK